LSIRKEKGENQGVNAKDPRGDSIAARLMTATPMRSPKEESPHLDVNREAIDKQISRS